ncbi:MAG: hypothetical protein D4R98_06335 [Comamonadaceae bacterium]|nr:MAG: hypothetical protein D4R98_06335 [Comamonadaceae bacterium]
MSLDTSDGVGLRQTARADFFTQIGGANNARFIRLLCTWPVVYAVIAHPDNKLALNGNIKSP